MRSLYYLENKHIEIKTEHVIAFTIIIIIIVTKLIIKGAIMSQVGSDTFVFLHVILNSL